MNLTDKTQKELYSLAKDLNIAGRSRMNKSELLLAVSAAQNEEEVFEDYDTYCKNYILDSIDDHEGESVHMSDLDSLLIKSDDMTGSITCNTWRAQQYIKEWFESMTDFYEHAKDQYDGPIHNPFESAEAFMVEAVASGIRSILSQCDTVDENYNDELELTPKIIKQIKKEVSEVFEITF